MLKHSLILSFLMVITTITSKSQDQLNHEKKVFVSPEGKIFFNKVSPVYFRVATSPEANAPSYLLHSEISAKYSNPMYFDTEGINTLHSPSAVDTSTKKVIEPKRDVLFEVYADGSSPVTKVIISNTKKFINNKVTYYGKNIQVNFPANDAVSGVEATYVAINQLPYKEKSQNINFLEEEKAYYIQYYSVDHVGNMEKANSISFSTDFTAPKTTLSIIGENKGKVLSSKASIKLISIDTLSGVSQIKYSINDGTEKIYVTPIPLSVFKDGDTKLTYYAIDNVGNIEDVKVISTSTAKPEENSGASSYSFYIDKEAPSVSFEIVGDVFKGKNLFISERSKFQINATDEKSGVDKISYSQNNPSPTKSYAEPFAVTGEGIENISYAASDNVGNYALAQIQQVFVDKSVPKSSISFVGKQFFNRDTLFITKDTKITIHCIETGSGIQKIEYIADGVKELYTSPFHIEKDGFHFLEYNAVDNVNNSENLKKNIFIVDNIAPQIIYNFSVKAIGEKTVRGETYQIYPSNAMLYIAATDNATGGEHIEYKINGKAVTSIIPVKGLVPGNYEIEINAFDVLKNKSSQVLRFSIED